MENRKSKFVNAIMIICPIIIWACLLAVIFIENTTVNVCIIAFQLAVVCFQIVVYLIHKRKTQKIL